MDVQVHEGALGLAAGGGQRALAFRGGLDQLELGDVWVAQSYSPSSAGALQPLLPARPSSTARA